MTPDTFPVGGRLGFGLTLGLLIVVALAAIFGVVRAVRGWRDRRRREKAAAENLAGAGGVDAGEDPGLVFQDPGFLPPMPPMPEEGAPESSPGLDAYPAAPPEPAPEVSADPPMPDLAAPAEAPVESSSPGDESTPGEVSGFDLGAEAPAPAPSSSFDIPAPPPSGGDEAEPLAVLEAALEADTREATGLAEAVPVSGVGPTPSEMIPGLEDGPASPAAPLSDGGAAGGVDDAAGIDEGAADIADEIFLKEMEAKLEADPENLEALEWMAYMQFSRDQVDQAILTYLKLIELVPRKPDYRFYLAQSYEKAGYLDEARQTYEQVNMLEPPPVMADQVAQRLVGLDDPSQAVSSPGAGGDISSLLMAPGEDADANAPTGVSEISAVLTQYTAGDGSGTEELERKLEQDPGNVQLLDWLAFMHYSNGDNDKACNAYERLVEMDPQNQSAYYYLGNSLLKLERLEDALGWWYALLEDFPKGRFVRKTKRRVKEVETRLQEQGKPLPPRKKPVPAAMAAAAAAPDPISEPGESGDLVAGAAMAAAAEANAAAPESEVDEASAAALDDIQSAIQDAAEAISMVGDEGGFGEDDAIREAEALLGGGEPEPLAAVDVAPSPEPAPAPEPDPAPVALVAPQPDPAPAPAPQPELAPPPQPQAALPAPQPAPPAAGADGGVLAVQGAAPPEGAPGAVDVAAALKSGDIGELEAAFLQDPTNIQVHRKLAGAYLKVGRHDEAIACFEDLSEYHGGPGPLFDVGRAYLSGGYAGEAVRRFELLLERYPESREAGSALQLLVKARSAQREAGGSAPAALPSTQSLPAAAPAAPAQPAAQPQAPAQPQAAPAQPQAAAPAAAGGGPPIGQQRFDALLTTFLQDDRNRWLDFARKVGGYSPKVISMVEKLLAKEPENTGAREFLAFLYLANGKGPAASKVFQSLADRHPGDGRYILYQGNTMLASGRQPEARKLWQEALNLASVETPAGLMAAFLLKTLK